MIQNAMMLATFAIGRFCAHFSFFFYYSYCTSYMIVINQSGLKPKVKDSGQTIIHNVCNLDMFSFHLASITYYIFVYASLSNLLSGLC